MRFEPQFACLEPLIRETFARAKSDAGKDVEAVELELIEDKLKDVARSRVAFGVALPRGPVKITWAAVGALWAASQACSRLAREMFNAKRRNEERVTPTPGSHTDIGLLFMNLAQQLMTLNDPPGASVVRWHDLPNPEAEPEPGSDAALGNQWFARALAWILRHELAHVVGRHLERQKEEGKDSTIYETEADDQATAWLVGEFKADPGRELMSRPEADEIQLEARAVAIGFALIFVAMFEAEIGLVDDEHPPVAERLFGCLDRLGLREDSFAMEVLSDLLKAWLDPQGDWGRAPSSRDALAGALVKLPRLMAEIPIVRTRKF